MTASRALQVLVVDDDFRVAAMHADVVASIPGFEVQASVRTLAQARAAVAEHAPDLLLADVYLPDGNGIDLVRTTGLDAFILTAAAEPATVRQALASGVHAYLVKPFTRQTLGARLERFARFHRLLDTPHPLRQQEIDSALARLHGADLPVSAAASATEQLVLAALGDDECSAVEVAERTGVSRATAQRRLAAMAGRAVVSVRLRYGHSGRPEHLYSRPEKRG